MELSFSSQGMRLEQGILGSVFLEGYFCSLSSLLGASF